MLQPPAPPFQASISPPVAPPIGSCQHFNDWLNSQTPHQTLERIKLLTSWSASLSHPTIRPSRPSPTCSTCSQISLRPFVCLTCATPSCGSAESTSTSHAQNHFRKQNHSIAWDLRSEALFCFPCQSYVSHKATNRIKLNERFRKMDDYSKPLETSATGPQKKRKRRHENEISAEIELLQSDQTTTVVPARGIRNLGNSCYMSVILQSFFLNPFLRAYFLSDRHNRSQCQRAFKGETCLSCEVDSLFSEYYSSPPNEALAPTKFLHAFWSSSYEALGYAQQDAHEFLISTLNLLHSHSPDPTENPLKQCPCIIHNTFSGRTRSQIRCGRCGHQSETFEMFLDLSLDVRDRGAGKDLTRLQDCLQSFTTAEKLPAKYDCAACGNPPEQASKRLSITALPQVLCVQLKRFEHTALAGGGGGAKIDTFVQFPLELDMTPYLSANLDYPTLALKSPTNQNRYNLLSVVAHEGSLSQGHYTTYVRGTDDFFHIDDEKVRRCGLKEVQSSKAYLLVYSRI
ncbi:UBP-type zinc finger domain-containing protein [Sporobolomyces salmoneus]|uniref:UBP-type zinc finger domain-containing protein n=1 Tax=Sporobolomyces salmoneus TaxID=183962 RepID=UPI003177DBF6